MEGLNTAFIDEAVARLEKLDSEAAPSWGVLKPGELVPHLIGTLRSSMREIPGQQFMGNWFTRTLLPPVVCTGWILPPKHLKTIQEDGSITPAITSPGDLNVFRETCERFIAGCQRGTLETSVHPLFGDIGPARWAKVHVVHTRHHFKQFRL